MALTVVGFTGSLEASTERGPKEGLVSLNRSSAQGVMGGSSLLKLQDKKRVAGDPLTLQTPDTSGVVAEEDAALVPCANVKDENASEARRVPKDAMLQIRI